MCDYGSTQIDSGKKIAESIKEVKHQRKKQHSSEGAFLMAAVGCEYYQRLFLIILYASDCG